MKSLEAAIGTGHKETHTHWTPAAKKALVRPTTPSAVTLLLDSGYNLRGQGIRGQVDRSNLTVFVKSVKSFTSEPPV